MGKFIFIILSALSVFAVAQDPRLQRPQTIQSNPYINRSLRPTGQTSHSYFMNFNGSNMGGSGIKRGTPNTPPLPGRYTYDPYRGNFYYQHRAYVPSYYRHDPAGSHSGYLKYDPRLGRYVYHSPYQPPSYYYNYRR